MKMYLMDYLKLICLIVIPFITAMYLVAIPISYIFDGTVRLVMSAVAGISICLIMTAWINHLI